MNDWADKFINPTFDRVFYSEVYHSVQSYDTWIEICNLINANPVFDYVNEKVRW